MKANYVDGAHQLFTKEEEVTVSEFIKLWEGYSGLKVDKNEFKATQRHISFSIQWLDVSFGFVLVDEYEHWVVLNHQYEGWFAMMIEFGMKCYERMMGLETDSNIESYPFWEGLSGIAVSERTVFVE